MVEIDFDKFDTEATFRLWLLSDEGRVVFDYVYMVVIESFDKPIRHIPVIIKKYDGTVYSIDMQNIKGFCTKGIAHYEYLEEYEKCANLVNIIKQLNNE